MSELDGEKGEITCSQHPDRKAISRCTACGRAVCEECRAQDENGLCICTDCARAKSEQAELAELEKLIATPEASEAEPQQEQAETPSPENLLQELKPEWIPWENDRPESDFKAFIKTLFSAFFRPIQFVRSVPWDRDDFASPFCFALICGCLGQIATAAQLISSPTLQELPELSGLPLSLPALSFCSLALVPITLCCTLFLESGIAHFFLRLSGMAHSNYAATFRAFSYAQAARIAMFLPQIGSFIQSFFLIFFILNGVRSAHRAGFGAGLLALLPMILLQTFTGSFLQRFPLP